MLCKLTLMTRVDSLRKPPRIGWTIEDYESWGRGWKKITGHQFEISGGSALFEGRACQIVNTGSTPVRAIFLTGNIHCARAGSPVN
jgi:hypothetical protein